MKGTTVARVATAAALMCSLAACRGGDSTTTATSPSPSATVPLTGVVTSSAGGPIAGARVSIQPSANTLDPSVFTDSAGVYRFDKLIPGDTMVHAEAMRFDQAFGQVKVDGSNRLNFVLRPTLQTTLQGVVQDADTGAPIANATVTFMLTAGATDNAGRTTTTNAQGQYRFDDVYAANSNLSATAEGYGEARSGLRITGPASLNFQLKRAS